MATEGPLIHDGSQTTANADLSTGLNGPSSSGQFLAVKIVGSRLVDLAASGSEFIYGILQNKPTAGQAADVGILGVSKAVAGAVVTAGNYLTTDTSGRLIPAATTSARVAVAIEGAAATGVVFTVAIVPGPLGRDVT